MGMLGNQLAAGQALTVANDSFNGDGSTVAFTLSQTVSSVNDIEVLVDNVQQSPYDSSYSVSGTTLTFSGAPSAGTNNVYVIYNASKHITTQQVIPDDGSVHSSKIATGAVTDAKIAAMSASKLTGNVAASNMPAGSVIQRAIYKGVASGHEVANSSTLAASSFLTGSITSKANNSLFCIVAWHGMMHTQEGTIGFVNCQRTVGGVNTKIQTGGSYDGSSYVDLSIGSSSYNNMYFPLSFHYSDLPSASAGTSITYSLLFARESGANLFYFVHNQGPYYFEITEIAQ